MTVICSVTLPPQSAATKLVDAHRSALFLVDSCSKELYAHMFSVDSDESDCIARVACETEPSSVDDYIQQLGSALKECVSYKGELVKYAQFHLHKLLMYVEYSCLWYKTFCTYVMNLLYSMHFLPYYT